MCKAKLVFAYVIFAERGTCYLLAAKDQAGNEIKHHTCEKAKAVHREHRAIGRPIQRQNGTAADCSYDCSQVSDRGLVCGAGQSAIGDVTNDYAEADCTAIG